MSKRGLGVNYNQEITIPKPQITNQSRNPIHKSQTHRNMNVTPSTHDWAWRCLRFEYCSLELVCDLEFVIGNWLSCKRRQRGAAFDGDGLAFSDPVRFPAHLPTPCARCAFSVFPRYRQKGQNPLSYQIRSFRSASMADRNARCSRSQSVSHR